MKHIYLLCLLALSACENKAITYAHAMDPCAQCSAIHTDIVHGFDDTAVCITLHEIWTCQAGESGIPTCVVSRKTEQPLIAETCYTSHRP